MARLVILYFEDNEGAETFVELADQDKVVGLYGIPTKFCDDISHSRYGMGVGQKYGWRMCRKCGGAIRSYQVARNLQSTTGAFRAGHISFSEFVVDSEKRPNLKSLTIKE
jgi:hypothetical protein